MDQWFSVLLQVLSIASFVDALIMCGASPILQWHKIFSNNIPKTCTALLWMRLQGTKHITVCSGETQNINVSCRTRWSDIQMLCTLEPTKLWEKRLCLQQMVCWDSYTFWSFLRWIQKEVLDLHVAVFKSCSRNHQWWKNNSTSDRCRNHNVSRQCMLASLLARYFPSCTLQTWFWSKCLGAKTKYTQNFRCFTFMQNIC